jgi:hypothetical protein
MTRVAWLADASPVNQSVDVDEFVDNTHNAHQFEWFASTARATIAQRDPASGLLTLSVQYLPSRPDAVTGRPLFVPADLAVLLNTGDISPLAPLNLRATNIAF